MRSATRIHTKRSATNRQPSPLELQELQHLAELGRLSATLLHEISNPLTTALLHLEQHEDQTSPGIRQARHSIQFLRSYVEAARQQVRRESTLTDFRVRAQITQLKRVVMPLAKNAGVQLVIETVPDCRLYGDPVKFQQILANLIVNAIEAYGHDSHVGLVKPVRVQLVSTEHFLSIRVFDWGQGIDAKRLGRVFEPFYTTKNQAGHGLGIGLAIVHQYVTNEFGGSIKVTSSSRNGTLFTVKLPAPTGLSGARLSVKMLTAGLFLNAILSAMSE